MIKRIAIRTLLIMSILCISCSKDGEEEAPDTLAPTVSFSIKGVAPSNSETPVIGNTIEIEINAQDAKGISKVEAFMDDSQIGEDTQAPFQITIDLTSFAKKLIGKGTVISKTQTQYTLKVSATDLAGNVSSTEQEIIVDNELPTITAVSLETNAVIAGEENVVTFTARDNKDISALEVKVNEVVVEATALVDDAYTVNIDTSVLEDGQNNLNITVTDQAGNTAAYTAPFFADNTGPEITLEGLSEGSIIDETTMFTMQGEDLYSDVESLEIYLNDTSILSAEGSAELTLDFNPDDYDTGDAILRIQAIDTLGNESTVETSFQIKRLLLKIDIPTGFLDPTVSKFYVFASNNAGELLDIKQLEYNTSFIKLNTLEDISPNTEYMLNFAYFYSGVGQSSYINTIQNVKRSTVDQIDLKVEPKKTISAQNTYAISSFPSGASIVGEASDHHSNGDPLNPSSGYYVEDYSISGTNAQSNKYYIYYKNYANGNYGYQLVDKPLPTDFYLDYNDFISDGVETRHINASSVQDSETSCHLALYGYLTASDFENDIRHRIANAGGQNISILGGPGFNYDFNTNFYTYSYKATLENYHVEAIGEPLSYYTAPDWSVDYTYSSTNKTFTLNTTGTTHHIGKIVMDASDPNSFYTWTVLFNSQSTTEVVLPELPEELQSWNINNYYTTGNLTTELVEIKNYDGLNSYDTFLQAVIKNSEYRQHKVSEKIESIFTSTLGAESGIELYLPRPDFSFFENWYH